MSPPLVIAAWSDWAASVAPWLAFTLATLVLVVTMRRRWKRTPVLARCVILSLYAHLLFATIAYTTNFMAWRPGTFGSGNATREVRVRIITDIETPLVEQPVEPNDQPSEPTDDVPSEMASVPTRVEIAEQQPAPPVESQPPAPSPPLAELPLVSLPTKPPATLPLESVVEVPADVAPRYAESVQAAEQTSRRAGEQAGEKVVPVSSVPPPVSSAAPPDLYRLRFSNDRAGIVESAGGNPDTEAAVKLALEWLVANQEADGRWSAARHEAGRGAPQQGQNRGDTGIDADTGITGLAVLALLGAGHTHLEGDHRLAVQHGLEFLISSQRTDGCLAGNARLFASMYCHGMATLALAEAMAVTRDPRLKPFVERAVSYTVAAQHSGGGWRYQPGDVGDMSQFGWQIMGLKSAELAGVNVPDITRHRAQRFLQTVSSGRHGGLASYRANERSSRTMTAEALLCRYLLETSPAAATRDEATSFLLQELPSSGAVNVYYWYYGTLALRFTGGASWQRWNESLQKGLLQSQRHDARLTGSWDPDRVWGSYGGRVYQTALSALCLESYYRYDTAAIEGPTLR